MSHLKNIGEGCLWISGDGQSVRCYTDDPVAQENFKKRPRGSANRMDTAHLSQYVGTKFVQWYGRKRDGMFHPFGNIMMIVEDSPLEAEE